MTRSTLFLAIAALALVQGCATAPPEVPADPVPAAQPAPPSVAAAASAPMLAESALPYARLGHRLAENNRIDEAMKALSHALTLDPKQPEALRDRAILLHAAGRHAEALVDIDLAVALRPDDTRTVGARCVIRVAAENSDAGLADCQRALTLPQGRQNAYTSLGQAQLLRGRPTEALAAFDQALALQANHMRALYGRGLARQALGDAGGAQDTREALRRLPGAAREFHTGRPAA